VLFAAVSPPGSAPAIATAGVGLGVVDGRGDAVHAQINLRFGDEKSVFGKQTAASLAAQMLNRGSKNHSRQQIADEFDKLKARVSFTGGPTSASVSIQTVRENLPATLKLVAEILRQPTFPDSEFDQVKQANLARIGRGPAGIAGSRGECGARGRLCNPLPGGIGHQPAGTTTGARGAIAGLGQVGAGNARK